jgi:S-adenosylmethionine/arginine decarboxylase-like enzyme
MSLDAVITKVEKRLDALEVKSSSPKAVRELVTRLDAKITEAQEKGYGVTEIVDLITECGFTADPDHLRKSLTQALESKRKKAPAQRGKPRARKTTTRTQP